MTLPSCNKFQPSNFLQRISVPAIALMWLLAGCEASPQQPMCIDLSNADSTSLAILDQLPASPPISCSVVSAPSPLFDSPVLNLLVVSDMGRLVTVFTTSEGLFWANFSANGELGETTKISDDGYSHRLINSDNGVALAWTKSGTAMISLLPSEPGPTTDLNLGPGEVLDFFAIDNGYGLFLRDNPLEQADRLLLISPSGELFSEVSFLGANSFDRFSQFSNGEIVTAYSDKSGCHLRTTGSNGNTVRSTLLHDTSDNVRGRCFINDLMSTDEGWLVALSVELTTCDTFFIPELQENEPAREQHIELARIDRTGSLIGLPVKLNSPQVNIREMSTRLMKTDEGIAVMWSRGSVSYVCGGCIDDDELNFAILSDELAPLSAPVVMKSSPLTAQMASNKLLPLGDSLLVAFSYVFHAISRPGLATMQCSPTE